MATILECRRPQESLEKKGDREKYVKIKKLKSQRKQIQV